MKYIDASITEMDKSSDQTHRSEESVLQRLVKTDRHYAFIMTFDMLFAGIDTVTFVNNIID